MANCFRAFGGWSKGDDIYVGVPTLRGEFKTSLHASGVFRHAFVNNQVAARFLGAGKDRAVEKWRRPSPTPEGVTWLLQLAIPGAGLGSTLNEHRVPNATHPLVRPSKAELLVVSVVLMPPIYIGSNIGFEGRPLRVLDSWFLKSGKLAAVVVDLQPLPMNLRKFLKNLSPVIAKVKAEIAASEEPHDLRLNLPLTLSDKNSKAVLDCELNAIEGWIAEIQQSQKSPIR